VDVLFNREVSMLKTVATPEQQARLIANLDIHIKRIGDPTLRALYERQMRDRVWALFGGKKPKKSRHAVASDSLRRKLAEQA
jgi:DNA primase